MKMMAAAVAFTATTLLAPQYAAAGPHTLYEFKVTSYGCSTYAGGGGWGEVTPGVECRGTYGLEDINGMRVGITAGQTAAALSMRTLWEGGQGPSTSEYTNTNIEYAALSRIGAEVSLRDQLCYSDYTCTLTSNFAVNDVLQLLSGYFLLLLNYDMIEMSSSGSTLWTGYYSSDSIPSDRLVFTGIWYETPEPSPVALIGAGLAGLMFMRRRKDTRAQA